MRRQIKRIIKNIRRKIGRQSFSLNELDLRLAKYIKTRNGFFIEAGANDGIQQSNTLYFEKYLGWKGLLIEPIPSLADQCRVNRPSCIVENCALVSSDYEQPTIEMQYNGLMSIVTGAFGDAFKDQQHIQTGMKFLRNGQSPYKISVPAQTLSAVLSRHGVEHVDLLSLDVEGYELDVLRGLDFNRHKIGFLLIELWHEKRDSMIDLLSPFYRHVSDLYSNDKFADTLFQAK